MQVPDGIVFLPMDSQSGKRVYLQPAVAVTFALALLTLFSLTGGGCGDDDGPAQAVEQFIRVTADQDCEGMVALYSEDSIQATGSTREDVVTACQQALLAATGGETRTEVTRFEVTDVKREGDEATVYFSMAVSIVGQDGEVPRDDYLKVKLEDGQWKVVLD